ncbi:MAG: hypothetical protein ACRD3E_11035 [Terriglobales bacterium]
MAIVLVIVIIICSAWITSHDASVRFQQTVQDDKSVHHEAQQQQQTAIKAEDQNQNLLTAALAALAQQKSQPVSSQVDYDRIREMIKGEMGVTAEVKADPQHPDAPSATLPAKQLRDFMLDSDACKANLSSCQQTTANVTSQLNAEKKDHQATKNDLDEARKALKGGSFFSRLKSNLKHSLCGGSGGAVGVVAGQKAGAPAGAVAAGAAFVGCELLTH